jgi:hypothetical protein
MADLAPVHWAILLVLLAVPVAGCVLLDRLAVRAAERPRRPPDPERMPVEARFLAGYLPYTGVPVIGLVVLAVVASGPMAAAAAIAALAWALVFALLQLLILLLRSRRGDRAGFHAGCTLITLANLVAVPALLAAVAWVLG